MGMARLGVITISSDRRKITNPKNGKSLDLVLALLLRQGVVAHSAA